MNRPTWYLICFLTFIETAKATPSVPIPSINIQLASSQSAEKSALEVLAPYAAAIISVAGTLFVALVVALFTLYQNSKRAKIEARHSYAAETLKIRIRQIEEFYAPALLLVEQSRIVHEKLIWHLKNRDPNFTLKDFRLLDHINEFLKKDNDARQLVLRILMTGNKLTKLISRKSGLLEGGISDTFIEYQSHFALLLAARMYKLTKNQTDGWQEFGYYPRMLNREIREGYKAVLNHLESFTAAGDEVIRDVLNRKSFDIDLHRRQTLETIQTYEKNPDEYAKRFDAFDLSNLRKKFITQVKASVKEGSPISILDIGCGSGRDTVDFIENGFVVTGVDASPGMLRRWNRKVRDLATGQPELIQKAAKSSRSYEKTFDEINFNNTFDGIWASASLLHVSEPIQQQTLARISKALKSNGTIFISYKYGKTSFFYDGRFFCNQSHREIYKSLRSVKDLGTILIFLTDKTGRELSKSETLLAKIKNFFGCNQDLWINLLAQKK